MTKLETIRQKCIEANPEINNTPSVRIGSRVVLSNFAIKAGIKQRRNWGDVVGESRDGKCWTVRWDTAKRAQPYAKDFVTLSVVDERPIRLADVLLAIEGKLYDSLRGNGFTERKWIEVVRLWNLREDDLTKQSEETIEFIASLLK